MVLSSNGTPVPETIPTMPRDVANLYVNNGLVVEADTIGGSLNVTHTIGNPQAPWTIVPLSDYTKIKYGWGVTNFGLFRYSYMEWSILNLAFPYIIKRTFMENSPYSVLQGIDMHWNKENYENV